MGGRIGRDGDHVDPTRSGGGLGPRWNSNRRGAVGGGGGDDYNSKMFDRMHHRLHDIAIERPGDDKSTARKEYTLDAVPKSGGGLNDDVSAPVAINNVLRVRTFVFLSLSIWPMFKTKSRIESS